MTRTIQISDDLAREIERHRESHGLATIDAAAAEVIALGLEVIEEDLDIVPDNETLRALINEGEASGPLEPWNSEEVFTRLRARHTTKP